MLSRNAGSNGFIPQQAIEDERENGTLAIIAPFAVRGTNGVRAVELLDLSGSLEWPAGEVVGHGLRVELGGDVLSYRSMGQAGKACETTCNRPGGVIEPLKASEDRVLSVVDIEERLDAIKSVAVFAIGSEPVAIDGRCHQTDVVARLNSIEASHRLVVQSGDRAA